MTVTLLRIIGIGSPFGQDQLGWLAVSALQETDLAERLAPTRVEFHCCQQPTALPALVSGADAVVIIDAMQDDSAPGSVRRLHREELAKLSAATSTHGLDVASALSLAEALGDLPAQSLLLGIAMANREEVILSAESLQELKAFILGIKSVQGSDAC